MHMVEWLEEEVMHQLAEKKLWTLVPLWLMDLHTIRFILRLLLFVRIVVCMYGCAVLGLHIRKTLHKKHHDATMHANHFSAVFYECTA